MTIEEIEALSPGITRSNETLRLWASFIECIATALSGKVFRLLWADWRPDNPKGSVKQFLQYVNARLEGIGECLEFLESVTEYTIPAASQFAETVRTRDVSFATRFYLGTTKTANQSLGDIRTILKKDKDSHADSLLGVLPQIAKSEAA